MRPPFSLSGVGRHSPLFCREVQKTAAFRHPMKRTVAAEKPMVGHPQGNCLQDEAIKERKGQNTML